MSISASTDFQATISITNPSLITQDMMSLLPSNYTTDQNSNVFAMMYGTGYALENLKENVGQNEANNYLYSPLVQNGQVAVDGIGLYTIEFDVPFVVPPLNSTAAGSSSTDVFIEYTSRFGMVINVINNVQDNVLWTATGSVGAATSEFLGDALYNNFGSVLGLKRTGDSVIQDSFVKPYESFTTFVNVDEMVTVLDLEVYPGSLQYNPPPTGQYFRGQLRQTSVVTSPTASHELVDGSGNIIALLSFDISQFNIGTTTNVASAFIPANMQAEYGGTNNVLPTYDVFIAGNVTAFTFNRWDQLAYTQEVFRADNVYRRLLAGINLSLNAGPTKNGLATMFETILAQPYIPADVWDQSDFRIFNDPKYLTYNLNEETGFFDSVTTPYQYQGFPTVPPVVQVHEVETNWTPETVTYNNRPVISPISDVPPVQVSDLNVATTFDLTNELVRQLRVGIDAPTGGVLDWNSLSGITPTVNGHAVVNAAYTTGIAYNGTTYNYNYVFLNNQQDSVANLTIFYYQKQVDSTGIPTGYRAIGPLKYNRDYFTVDVSSLYRIVNGRGGYDLPSEIMVNYNANSNLPALATTGNLVQGVPYTADPAANLPPLPSVVLKFDFSNAGLSTSGGLYTYTTTTTMATGQGTLITVNVQNGESFANQTVVSLIDDVGNTITGQIVDGGGTNELIMEVNSPSGTINLDSGAALSSLPWKFPVAVDDILLYSYVNVTAYPGVITGSFDADPNDATLTEYCDSQSGHTIQPSDSPFINSATQLAQGSFARFTSVSGYDYVASMVGGQVTFNKTIQVSDLLTYTCQLSAGGLGPAGIVIMKATQASAINGTLYTNTANVFSIQGTITKNIQLNNQPYFQVENADYLLLNTDGFPVALFSADSSLNLNQYLNDPTPRVFTGFVSSVIWDTRIPVSDYQDAPPVFQASCNFDAEVDPFTPNVDLPDSVLPVNYNFLVLIQTLPVGNEQTITASWSFAILQQQSVQLTSNYNNTINVLAFPDLPSQPGIMTYYTGRQLLRELGADPDSCTYTQTYVSPNFQAWFLGYKDYLGTSYGNGVFGGKLSAQGDGNVFDTVYNSDTTDASKATILSFFNPILGIFSMSVAPNMEFFRSDNNNAISIIRPRNLGIAFSIERDSYAGLCFYGYSGDKIVDKPLRLLIDYAFSASGEASRHRIVEIESNENGAWVDGMHPDDVQTGSTFFLAGNQFKYAATGYDQGVTNEDYSLTSVPPAYESDAGHTNYSTPDTSSTVLAKGSPGVPQRYRRPPTYITDQAGHENFDPAYLNKTPEKIAYFQFDLDTFPFDTLVKSAQLEIYFCSGFTIAEGTDRNLTLSDNSMWNKSRLSGNGKTQLVPLTDAYGNFIYNSDGSKKSTLLPLNNVHWRKNFFEVLIPYAFKSADENNALYGIANLFNQSNFSTVPNVAPASELEYLGFINIDEISVAPLGLGTDLYQETTQGLTNIILTKNSVIRLVSGSLHSDDQGNPDVGLYDAISSPDGLPTYTQAQSLAPGIRYQQVIAQNNVLPNMKVIVFPFGDNGTNSDNPLNSVPDTTMPFVYGYVKSLLASSQIAFDSNSILLYKSLIDYVCPAYAQYNVKLLESDTYLPYMTFGKTTQVEDSLRDISS